MLRALPATATTSGVRVSCRPRRMPVVASMTSSGVTPRKAIRRYVVAGSATSGPAPSRRTSGPVVTTPTRVMTTPRPMASQTPSMPWARAARRSPAPSRRATLAVVPYARKTQRPTNVWSTMAAMPRPGQGRGAEVADDRRVGEQEQRLRDEREERRERQPPDLAIQ